VVVDANAIIRAGFGIGFVGTNLFPVDPAWWSYIIVAVQTVGLLAFASVISAFLLVGPWSRDAAVRRRAQVGVVVAGLVALAIAFFVQDWVLPILNTANLAGFYKVYRVNVTTVEAVAPFASLLGILAARRAARTASVREAWALAALSLGLTMFWADNAGNFMGPFASRGNPILPLVTLATALSVAVAWIPVTRSPGRWAGWAVIWGTLLVILFGQSEAWLLGTTDTSAVGILRTVAALLVGLALLGRGLEIQPAPRVPARRGTLAAAALATLFIVAQVAQNFLSAEYGLLTGGVIAGVVLFAANPVQKAFEGMGEHKTTDGRQRGPAAARKRHETLFRDAVRLAAKDRRFDHEEELTLARLADSMGLSTERATEIRHDVEREKGVA
jgi:hypothetical protein